LRPNQRKSSYWFEVKPLINRPSGFEAKPLTNR
jgi:hypothetical protein